MRRFAWVIGAALPLVWTAPVLAEDVVIRIEAKRGAEAAAQTAAAWGAEPQLVEALRDCDYGAWRGQSLEALQATAAQDLAAWLTDPAAAPHGGESQAQLCERVGTWLDAFDEDGHFIVVSHPAVLRAAALHVLQADAAAFNAIDVEPLGVLRLVRNGRWRLRL